MTWTADASATSRSAEVPPVNTVTRIEKSHAGARARAGEQSPSADELLEDIVPAHDPDQLAIFANQGRRTFAGEHGAQAIGGAGEVDFWERRFHDLPHRAIEQRRLSQRLGHQGALDQPT